MSDQEHSCGFTHEHCASNSSIEGVNGLKTPRRSGTVSKNEEVIEDNKL